MGDVGILQICGVLAALGTGLAMPVAIIRWCGSFVAEKVSESEKALRVTIDNQGHKIANVTTRVDAMERLRSSDVERIVKLETNLSNLEKGQERIEHALEKMEAESAKGRAEIIESLRELRTVTPKA